MILQKLKQISVIQNFIDNNIRPPLDTTKEMRQAGQGIPSISGW